MSDPRWTKETQDVAAEAMAAAFTFDVDEQEVRVVLSWLADAGLLLPPGTVTGTNWAVLVGDTSIEEAEGEADARTRLQRYYRDSDGARVACQAVHYGPWQDAPTPQASTSQGD